MHATQNTIDTYYKHTHKTIHLLCSRNQQTI